MPAHLVGERMRLDVLDDADDFHGIAHKIPVFDVELLSDRTTVGPGSRGDILIDNSDGPIFLHVDGIEVPPGDELRPKALEIAGKNRAVVGHDRVLFGFRRAFRPIVAVPVRQRVIERQMRNHSHGIDSIASRELLLQLAKELDRRFGSLIFRSRDGEAHRHHVFCIESGIHAEQTGKRLQK